MNQKCLKSQKMRAKLKTLQAQFVHLSEKINSTGFFIRVGGATERSFRKMELGGKLSAEFY